MASRRTALQMGLSLPVALGWPGPLRASPVERLSTWLRRLFSNPAAACAAGARLGTSVLPEHRLTEIVAAVEQGRGALPPIPADPDVELLRAALRERARDDFRAGRTLWFEGWLLAETEARLLRIAYLTGPR